MKKGSKSGLLISFGLTYVFQVQNSKDNKHEESCLSYPLHWVSTYSLVPAAEIREHETGLVSGPFSWFQSRQLFLETHETEANSVSSHRPLYHFCFSTWNFHT